LKSYIKDSIKGEGMEGFIRFIGTGGARVVAAALKEEKGLEVVAAYDGMRRDF